MRYLLLWSGDVPGMYKARIPALPCKGLLHSIDEHGAAVVPCRDAIREALPRRLRPAFDRSQACQLSAPGSPFDARGRQRPLIYDLLNTRLKCIARLYLQPLTPDCDKSPELTVDVAS